MSGAAGLGRSAWAGQDARAVGSSSPVSQNTWKLNFTSLFPWVRQFLHQPLAGLKLWKQLRNKAIRLAEWPSAITEAPFS